MTLGCQNGAALRRRGIGAGAWAGLERLEARALLAVTFDLREYFPSDQRDTWSYVDQADLSPAGTTATLAYEPTTGQPLNTTLRIALFTFTSGTGTTTFEMRFRVGPAGLRVIRQTAVDGPGLLNRTVYPVAGGMQLLPVLVTAGQEQNYSRAIAGLQTTPLADSWTGLGSGTVRVDGVEAITTDAGMFDALRITWTGAFTQAGSLGWTGSGTTAQTFWLVKGLGIVRYTFEQSENNTLNQSREDEFDLQLTDAALLHVVEGFEVKGGPGPSVIPFRSTTPLFSNGTNFGKVTVGAGFHQRTFTVTNTTAFPVMLGALPGNRIDIRITGGGAADFEVIATGGWFLSAGQSTTVTVRFTPSKTGARVADIAIGAPEGFTPFSFRVRGTGI